MAQDSTRMFSQEDAERLLRYYRSYYLLYDTDGRFLSREKRHRMMDDELIRFAAEEFVEANKFNPLGGASRGVGKCTCAAGPGTNPSCPVHP